MDDAAALAHLAFETRLRERLALLRAKREQAIADASRAIGVFDGAIGELESLLVPPPSDDVAAEAP